MQLRVFCLGLLEDLNVRLGVFPQGEEILIDNLALDLSCVREAANLTSIDPMDLIRLTI